VLTAIIADIKEGDRCCELNEIILDHYLPAFADVDALEDRTISMLRTTACNNSGSPFKHSAYSPDVDCK